MSSADVRLAEIRGDVQALIELLTATRSITRLSAANALGDLGDPAAVQPLVRCLRANDDLVRNAALNALAKIRDPSAAPALLEVATTDEASGVRTTAINALAAVGDPRGIEMLVRLAVDPAALIGTASRTFRTSLTGRYQPTIRTRWVRGALKRLRELRAVEALPQLEASRPPRSPLLRLRFNRTRRVLRG